jgi:hypothetical protein
MPIAFRIFPFPATRIELAAKADSPQNKIKIDHPERAGVTPSARFSTAGRDAFRCMPRSPVPGCSRQRPPRSSRDRLNDNQIRRGGLPLGYVFALRGRNVSGNPL